MIKFYKTEKGLDFVFRISIDGRLATSVDLTGAVITLEVPGVLTPFSLIPNGNPGEVHYLVQVNDFPNSGDFVGFVRYKKGTVELVNVTPFRIIVQNEPVAGG